MILGLRRGGPPPVDGEPCQVMGEFEAILAVEPLTVEGLFFRLLQAETQGLRARVAEGRRPPGNGPPGAV